MGNALDFLIEGTLVELLKYNGNPIGLELPMFCRAGGCLTEPGVRGDSSSGSVTKPATLETGLEIRVPLFIKEGERVRSVDSDRGVCRPRMKSSGEGGARALPLPGRNQSIPMTQTLSRLRALQAS